MKYSLFIAVHVKLAGSPTREPLNTTRKLCNKLLEWWDCGLRCRYIRRKTALRISICGHSVKRSGLFGKKLLCIFTLHRLWNSDWSLRFSSCKVAHSESNLPMVSIVTSVITETEGCSTAWPRE